MAQQQNVRSGTRASTGRMALKANTRNLLFFLLWLAVLPVFVRLVVLTADTIHQFDERGVRATYTYITAVLAWLVVSVLTPLNSLRRMANSRIATGDVPSVFRLLKLRFPWAPQSLNARSVTEWDAVMAKIDRATTYAVGDKIPWSVIQSDDYRLTEKELEAVKEIVEDNVGVRYKSVSMVEMSFWLLLFSNLVLTSLIMLAGRYAALEVFKEKLNGDFQVGKVLGEWLANYVLLFAAFLQVVSRGIWFGGLWGVCGGPIASIGKRRLNLLVAVYIANADGQVLGLSREGCYCKRFEMEGCMWSAPTVTSAVLALLGEPFVVREEDGRRFVDWQTIVISPSRSGLETRFKVERSCNELRITWDADGQNNCTFDTDLDEIGNEFSVRKGNAVDPSAWGIVSRVERDHTVRMVGPNR